MHDWLIVGGGLHGSLVARRLQATLPQADIAVIDTQESAATLWKQRADACGMYYLRSSQVHHLDIASDSLRLFAEQNGYGAEHFLGKYRRPTRPVFEAHTQKITQHIPRIYGHVEALEKLTNGWQVHTSGGEQHSAKRLVLALGPQQIRRPAWGEHLPHVFANPQVNDSQPKNILVVGGGVTAGQLAVNKAHAGHFVTLLTHHPLRVCIFDGDPCYIGPRCLIPFIHLPIPQRIKKLKEARNPGTLPPEIYQKLANLAKDGRARWIRGNVRQLVDNGVELDNREVLQADEIILATGFQPRAGTLIEQTAQRYNLPLDDKGNATTNHDLEWLPGLHLIGKPASLQLGPVAGNIPGARIAARRLAAFAQRQPI